jgi:hypothetical protein
MTTKLAHSVYQNHVSTDAVVPTRMETGGYGSETIRADDRSAQPTASATVAATRRAPVQVRRSMACRLNAKRGNVSSALSSWSAL